MGEQDLPQRISFDASGLWFLGYMIFVLITPATLDLSLFLIVLFSIALIELVDNILRIINNEQNCKFLQGQKS